MDVIREKEIINQQLQESVCRLSLEEQRALLNLLQHRGKVKVQKED